MTIGRKSCRPKDGFSDDTRDYPTAAAGATGEASLSLVDSERLELAVQRRALHAHELGGAGNIAAEPIDLRDQVFALEHLARVAQRQSHQVFAAVAVGHARN